MLFNNFNQNRINKRILINDLQRGARGEAQPGPPNPCIIEYEDTYIQATQKYQDQINFYNAIAAHQMGDVFGVLKNQLDKKSLDEYLNTLGKANDRLYECNGQGFGT